MGVSRCGTYLFATYKKIRCAIYSGQLSAGEKIPSVREMVKKREDTAKVLCFSYFGNMFALGFSKDEAENIRSEDAGETKDQASVTNKGNRQGYGWRKSIQMIIVGKIRVQSQHSEVQSQHFQIKRKKSADNINEQ